MLFNSLEFLFFLAIVYGTYRVLNWRSQNWILLLASYIFYGWWDLRFLFLTVICTVINFCASLLIEEGYISRQKRYLVSAYSILSAFFFVTLQWRFVQWQGSTLSIDWYGLLGARFGWSIFAATVSLAIVANVAYYWVIRLPESSRRALSLTLSMGMSLAILGFFKYFGFFVESAEQVLHALGLNVEFLDLHIILPVGISFYTFQTMGYTIDVYRGQFKPRHCFWDFNLFVVYFPLLLAGPIERATHLIPKLLKPRRLTFQGTAHGLHLIMVGLFKKVAIADGVAITVNQVYGSSGQITSTDVLVGTVFFALQVYSDFSGYSDIARGVSSLLGIRLVNNFHAPYLSQNPQEFWRRWHISLSTWLRDYLYISLGGNRLSALRTYWNLMVTMVLGGLWHGAAWNFALWGFYQGLLLCGHRLWSRWFKSPQHPPRWQQVINTVACSGAVLYGWLLFRADSSSQILEFTGKLLAFSGGSLGANLPRLSALVGIPVLLCLDWFVYHSPDEYYYHRLSRPVQGLGYALMIFTILLGMSNETTDFIYFAF